MEKVFSLLNAPETINTVVYVLTYGMFFCGITFMLYDVIGLIAAKTMVLAKEKQRKIKLKKKETMFDKHIRFLLEANFNSTKVTVIQFKVCILCLFMLFLILAGKVMIIGRALLISFAVAVMPYLLLRVRLEKTRSVASHEAEQLVGELLVKYRLKKFNIEEAIEEVIKIKNLNKTKGFLSKLLLKLRNTRNEQEIKEAVKVFSYSIGTNWAKVLGSNIYQASISDINITRSLEDILIELRVARKAWEQKIRDTAEPRRMLVCIPLLYILFLFVSLYWVDIPMSHYFRNQFASEQGVMFFSLIIIGFFVSVISVVVLFSRKFDF